MNINLLHAEGQTPPDSTLSIEYNHNIIYQYIITINQYINKILRVNSYPHHVHNIMKLYIQVTIPSVTCLVYM